MITTPCQLWSVPLNEDGYAIASIDGKKELVHRYLWEKVICPLLPGYHLHHFCEQKHCINLGHLAMLTPEEHQHIHSIDRPVLDSIPAFPPTAACGRKSKLSDAQKAIIVFELSKPIEIRPTLSQLGQSFGVSASTIGNIWRRYANKVGI